MFKDALLIALLILAGAVGGFSQSRFELDFGARAGLPFDISMESRLSGVASLSSFKHSIGLRFRWARHSRFSTIA